ncbi:PEBP-like protein, partial [Plenodomus tracheiphilus IPT5]
MVGKSVFGVGALMAASVTAQTAPDFPIQVSQQLGVAYGNNTVSPPGEKFPRPETANPPSINFSPSTPSPSTSRAVLLMVDTEVPQNNTRVQLIHWLATNITLSTTTPLAIPSPQPVPYLQPSPPVGDIPHTYSFLLYPQPDNFSIPAQYADLAQNRIGFNVTQFVADVGLTEPWAGNYITVQNLTG